MGSEKTLNEFVGRAVGENGGVTRFLAALLLCVAACGTFTEGQKDAIGIGGMAGASAGMGAGFVLLEKDSTCADLPECRNLYHTAPGGIALMTISAIVALSLPVILHYVREK